jgi:hypothetical protein
MGGGNVQKGNQDDEEEGDDALEVLRDRETEEQNEGLLLKLSMTQSLHPEME